MSVPGISMTMFLAYVVAITSPVAGKWWSIQAGGPGASQGISMNLAVQETKLTGTITEFTPQPRAILNGVTNGNRFSFETVGLMNGKEITVLWAGEVAGDEMIVTRKIQFDDGRIMDAPGNPLKLQRDKA